VGEAYANRQGRQEGADHAAPQRCTAIPNSSRPEPDSKTGEGHDRYSARRAKLEAGYTARLADMAAPASAEDAGKGPQEEARQD